MRCRDAVPDITFGTDGWKEVRGKDRLQPGRWYDLAAAYDTSEACVYVEINSIYKRGLTGKSRR